MINRLFEFLALSHFLEKKRISIFFLTLFILTPHFLFSVNVANWNQLNSAISAADVASTSTTITFTADITQATNLLPPLCIDFPNSSYSLLNNCSITIDGASHTLNQGASLRGLFVGGNPYNTSGVLANSSSVTIQDLTITGSALGGSGSGGGAGLGGGLFVCTSTTVNLSNVTFANCTAQGGSAGGDPNGGGMSISTINANGQDGDNASGSVGGTGGAGGGFAGGAGGTAGLNGGNATDYASGGGGGGGGSSGSGGSEGAATTAVVGYVGVGGMGGSCIGTAGAGGGGGGGGGFGGRGGRGGNGSVGGGPGDFASSGSGGFGGFGGGGGGGGNGGDGGAGSCISGGGGFGGGGADGVTFLSALKAPGNGGFGGGGGGGGGVGGFGGGSGGTDGDELPYAGGGLGAGGAIFVHTGATLNITRASFTASSVAGGTGLQSGQAYGKDIFLVSGGNINFNLTNDLTMEAIGGNYSQGGFTTIGSSGVTVNNNSGVTLTMTTPSGQSSYDGLFDGTLNLNGGILSIDSDYCLGYSTVNPSINGGTLAVTSPMTSERNFSIGSSGATFQPTTAVTLTINGVISGGSSGTLTKSGSGILTLSAANSYTGATTLSAGGITLSGSNSALGNNSALAINGGSFVIATGAGNKSIGSLSGSGGTINLNENTLTINQVSDGTYGGVISGSGGITKSGNSILTLSATNTYTGLTTLSAGGITLTGSGTIGGASSSLSISGGTLTLASAIGTRTIGGLSGSGGTIALNNNTLNINTSANSTFAGVFTGNSNANIIKQGTGMLTLTGTSSGFLGDTTIDAGTIAINGTLNGETTVNAGGRLQGVGTLDNLRNLGTVSPGNSIGTLTITGDFTVADPAAILEIEIDPDGTSDKLVITGNADLDGYVELLPNPGVYMAGQQFLILQAGSITDSFLGIVEAFPQDFQFLRLGNSIYIVVDGSFIISPYASLLTGNALLTYDYLFCVDGNDPDLLEIQNTLLALPTLQALSDALVQLCPALYSSLPLLELQNNVHMAQVMTQKSRKYFCDCNHAGKKTYPQYPLKSFWVQPIGFYYNQKGVQNQYGFDDYTYGMASGFLLPIPSGLLLDLGLGYTHSELKWNNSRGRADANTIYFAPSLSFWFEPFCISIIVQGDVNFYNTKRNIEFTGVSETAKGNFQSYDILCGLDFSAKIELFENLYNDHSTPFYIEPSVQFYCMNFFQQRFVEKDGGDLNLSVGHKHTVFLQPNLGLKITQEIRTKSLCFAPNLYVGYLANIPLKNAGYNSSIPEFNIPCFSDFTVYGYHRVTNQLLLGAEFVIKKCDRFLITAGYSATMFSHLFTQGVNARFSLEF